MNHQERRVSYYLPFIQGIYYALLGLTMLSSRIIPHLYFFDESSRTAYLTTLVPVILVVIGVALFLAKNSSRQHSSTAVLGVGIAFSLLSHHSFFLYQFDFGGLLWLDWLMQLTFVLSWIWLLYWQWIEKKFEDI